MTLSGGQRQRLAVADAMMSDKPVVIFDEPTSGLDYDHMLDFVKILRCLQAQQKVILVITHDSEFLSESGAVIPAWQRNASAETVHGILQHQ